MKCNECPEEKSLNIVLAIGKPTQYYCKQHLLNYFDKEELSWIKHQV